MEEQKEQQQVLNVDQITLKPDISLLISGSRRSGKSVLAVNILYRLLNEFEFHNVILISETGKLDNNCSYQNIVKDNMIFNTEKMDYIIDKIINHQMQSKKKNKLKSCIIILDDLNLKKKSAGSLQKLFSLGRHLNICILMLVQYPKLIVDGIIKSNCDIILCSRMNFAGIESIYECINAPLTKQQFYKYIQNNTLNHQFIMFNNLDQQPQLQTIRAQMMKITCDQVKCKKK